MQLFSQCLSLSPKQEPFREALPHQDNILPGVVVIPLLMHYYIYDTQYINYNEVGVINLLILQYYDKKFDKSIVFKIEFRIIQSKFLLSCRNNNALTTTRLEVDVTNNSSIICKWIWLTVTWNVCHCSTDTYHSIALI